VSDSDSAILCTVFDEKYLSRGLVMVESLRPHLIGSQKIVILALDFASFSFLRNRFILENAIEVLSFQDLPEVDFWQIRRTRTYVEFCWALGAVLSNALLLREKKLTVYVDADTCFFSSPQGIIDLGSRANASITPHRFPKRLQHLEVNGKYNVGWVSFAPTPIGIAISTEWRESCERSTVYDASQGIVGDQKYLDTWGEKYPGVLDLNDPGANLAPWNHESHNVVLREEAWFVDDSPLIFYHFHGFRTLSGGKVSPVDQLYRMVKDVPMPLYVKYFSLLSYAERGIGPWTNVPLVKNLVSTKVQRFRNFVGSLIYNFKNLIYRFFA